MLPALGLLCASLAEAPTARVVVDPKPLHPIDRRLFGQFMERPSWGGEIGVEAAVIDDAGTLDPRVEKQIAALRPPVIRFPHGTDLDFVDWRDMVTGVPGRDPARPLTRDKGVGDVSNRFGFDEFLKLCERLGSEPIIPLRNRLALLGEADIEAEAADGAKLVAYCVGEPDKLDGELRAWAELRVRNGRERPYRVPYWQIGNEAFVFWNDVRTRYAGQADARYVQMVRAYAKAIHAIQPDAKLLVDGLSPELNMKLRSELGDTVTYVVEHWYRPWDIREVRRGAEKVPGQSLTDRDIWYAWSTPTDIGSDGQATLNMHSVARQAEHGYRVAVTEWNWNGWWAMGDEDNGLLDSDWAKGVGAASFVHALIRNGHVIDLACQSMLVGQSWWITGVHVDPTGKRAPFTLPTAQVVEFLGRHHTGSRVALEIESPSFEQPFAMGGLPSHPRAALVDAVASREGNRFTVTLINRSFEEPVEAVVQLPIGVAGARARFLEAPLRKRWGGSARERSLPVTPEARQLRLQLPPRSVVGVVAE